MGARPNLTAYYVTPALHNILPQWWAGGPPFHGTLGRARPPVRHGGWAAVQGPAGRTSEQAGDGDTATIKGSIHVAEQVTEGYYVSSGCICANSGGAGSCKPAVQWLQAALSCKARPGRALGGCLACEPGPLLRPCCCELSATTEHVPSTSLHTPICPANLDILLRARAPASVLSFP